MNNAGWDELHPFLETDEPFWDRVIDVNFKGVPAADARRFCRAWSSASGGGS